MVTLGDIGSFLTVIDSADDLTKEKMSDMHQLGRTKLLPSSGNSITLRDYEIEEPEDAGSVKHS